EKETDHDSFASDDDEENGNFRFSLDDKDNDLPHNEPLHLTPLPSTTNSKNIPVILQADDEDIVPNVNDSTDLVSASSYRSAQNDSYRYNQNDKLWDIYIYIYIRGAIKQKFSFSEVEMSIIWPPVHDSILSKQCNHGKTLKSKATLNESIAITSTPKLPTTTIMNSKVKLRTNKLFKLNFIRINRVHSYA
ncbi:unnamed protein product, partial [Rotaria socialis]